MIDIGLVVFEIARLLLRYLVGGLAIRSQKDMTPLPQRIGGLPADKVKASLSPLIFFMEMRGVRLVPWRRVRDWFCTACGGCCMKFKVPLTAYETTIISKVFGYECLELGLGTYYLRRRASKRCIFQVYREGRWVCGIQGFKPMACKLWPFTICEKPEYGFNEEAEFEFGNERFYVYLNPYCRGMVYGRPSKVLVQKVVPEFVELRLGLRREQSRSTSLLKGRILMYPYSITFSTSPQSLVAIYRNIGDGVVKQPSGSLSR